MADQKHLTRDSRHTIERGLNDGFSFKEIGRQLGKDCTTISKEIRNHRVFEKPAVLGGASTTAKTEKPAVSRAAAIAVPGQSSDFAGPVLTVSLSALCTAPSPVQNLQKLLIPSITQREKRIL
jgi:hypothetical protein